MINIKDLYEIFKKAGKIDEYQKILDLIDDSFKKREEIEKLRKKNKELQEKLKFQNDLEFRNDAYWKKSDGDGPYCLRCWDKGRELIRIIPMRIGSNFATCPECKTKVNFTGKKPEKIVMSTNEEPFNKFEVF